MINNINKKGILKKVSTIIFSVAFFSVAFLFNSSYVFAEEEEDKGHCWFCNTKDTQAVKEKQFAQKIKIIKAIFNEKIDSAALAATVLYIDMDNSINNFYDKNFDENQFRRKWEEINSKLNPQDKKNSASYQEGQIDNEEIDLLTAATIVMLFSNNFGPYSEEAYKEALMLDKGFTDKKIKIIIEMEANNLFCYENKDGEEEFSRAGQAIADIVGGFKSLNPFTDYARSDVLTFKTHMNNICKSGFLGATYNSVKNISDPKIKKKKKEKVVNTIFYLASNYKKWYGLEDENCEFTGSTGSYADWLQCDPTWANVSLGGTSNICNWGCTATSSAIQIARSGTRIILPTGMKEFNPGTFVKTISKHGGFSGGGMTWSGWKSIAPEMETGYVVPSHYTKRNQKKMAQDFSKILNTPEKGKYQRFIILQFSYTNKSGYSSPQHWVAVEGVQNGTVIINDPGYKGNTFEQNYSAWNIYNYRVLYAKDVPFGSAGSGGSSSNVSSGSSCTVSGSIAGLIKFLGEIEGVPGSCKVRGEVGYKTYTDSMDQNYAGKTTAYGITQVYNKDLAKSVGYTNFNSDMSNGCAVKKYIDQMVQINLEKDINMVKKLYEKAAKGKQLQEYQYHALATIAHHWPVGVRMLIKEIAGKDPKSFYVYSKFLEYNGLHGAQGGLNRREAEYHLFYNGNYNLKRVFDVRNTRGYYDKRVKVYQSEKIE